MRLNLSSAEPGARRLPRLVAGEAWRTSTVTRHLSARRAAGLAASSPLLSRRPIGEGIVPIVSPINPGTAPGITPDP